MNASLEQRLRNAQMREIELAEKLDSAEYKLETYRKALAYYADESNWSEWYGSSCGDGGRKAREALDE